jgi:hypothetical protein
LCIIEKANFKTCQAKKQSLECADLIEALSVIVLPHQQVAPLQVITVITTTQPSVPTVISQLLSNQWLNKSTSEQFHK